MENTLFEDVMIAALIPFAMGGLFPIIGLSIALAAVAATFVGGTFISLRVMQIMAAQSDTHDID